MTREEAVSLLRRYRRDVCRFNPRFFTMPQRNVLFRNCVYEKFLLDELIRRIRHSTEPPIDVVYDVYSMLDDILSESDDDHFETHRFAAELEREAGQILRYLKMKEKENKEDAKI